MKETSLVKQCLEILKREDVKSELKHLFRPIIDFILFEIRPYTYITVLMIFMIFIMILAILVLLVWFLRSQQLVVKNSFV
jgi:hypothetical protein